MYINIQLFTDTTVTDNISQLIILYSFHNFTIILYLPYLSILLT